MHWLGLRSCPDRTQWRGPNKEFAMAGSEELRLFQALGLEVPNLRGDILDRRVLQGPGGAQRLVVAGTAPSRAVPATQPTGDPPTETIRETAASRKSHEALLGS